MSHHLPNPPNKHHYIPAFYLKRWADNNKLIHEFSRPYKDRVVFRPCHPNATGYSWRLYELRGLPKELAQQVETKFFRPCDTDASVALKKLQRSEHKVDLDGPLRAAWARFIFSLLVRCPEDIALLRKYFPKIYLRTMEKIENEYALTKSESDPPFSDYRRVLPVETTEVEQFKILWSMIDNEISGEKLINMTWWVKNVSQSKLEVLTSDRPIVNNFNHFGRSGYLMIPISTEKYFFASADSDFISRIWKMDQVRLVKWANKAAVLKAIKFVYGRSARQLSFIRTHFGSRPETRLIERVLKAQLSVGTE